jgi:hypothetical protein
MKKIIVLIILINLIILSLTTSTHYRIWKNKRCEGRPDIDTSQKAYCNQFLGDYFGAHCNRTNHVSYSKCDVGCRSCQQTKVSPFGRCLPSGEDNSVIYLSCEIKV